MSFILDALRKSEHERRRGAVPGISQIPLVARRAAVPSWAIAVIVLLAAAVAGLGIAWWETSHEAGTGRAAASQPLELPPSSAATAERSSPPPPLVPAATVATTAASPEVATAPTGDSTTVKTAAPTPQQHDGAAAVSSNQAPPARTPPVAIPADSSASEPPLPSPEALAAEGVIVPQLRLELHAYSDRPTDRYVFINGNKYVEGDRLAEGPQVITIVPSGVVLSAQGRRFLLTPE